jgi:hypothetical protein
VTLKVCKKWGERQKNFFSPKVPCSDNERLLSTHIKARARATRLGEFSPHGRVLTEGSYFGNDRSETNFVQRNVLTLTKNGLGYILGEFFTQAYLVTLVRA